jgi:hypothetical protein
MHIQGVAKIAAVDASDRLPIDKVPAKAAISVAAGQDDRPARLEHTINVVIPNGSVAPDTLKRTRETDDGKNTVYRLVNNQTGQVISQVPSQQVLNVESSIEQLLQQEMQKPKLDVKS